jgi:biotin carboxylase
MNYNVFVIGDKPSDYLAKFSTNYHRVNYANISLVKKFIEENNIEFIVPGCNDFSYKICSEICDEKKFYGIEHSQVNDLINNKNLFREFAIKIKLPVPSVFNLKNIPSNFSIIVKPVDSYSGNGITVLKDYNYSELKQAIKKAEEASKSKKHLIEEFVEGQLFSHSAFISNHKVYIDFFVEEHCITNEFAVDTSWVTDKIKNKIGDEIKKTINRFAKELNLKDGLIHTQFILSGNKFWIIEITRRCPGDLYSNLISTSTGYNYSKEYVKPFINFNVIDNKKPNDSNKIIRHTITSPKQINFGLIKFNEPILINNYISISTSGSELQEAPKGRVALIFLKSNNASNFNKIKSLLLSRELYSLSPKI